MPNFIPSNRWITIVLLLGFLALIIYGVVSHNPATIVIVAALLVFLGGPALVIFSSKRRAQHDANLDDRAQDEQ